MSTRKNQAIQLQNYEFSRS